VVGRQVRLNKHPFTILGVAPPDFHGTMLLFSPDYFVPMVNSEQIDRESFLNARGTRWVFEVLGHLKPGVTLAQATADLNSVGSYLEKSYPKDDGKSSFSLVRPGLHGDFFAPAIRAFLAGLMVLAGLILLAACANLGSLFAARAADHGREVAPAPRAGLDPHTHFAATVDRSPSDFRCRRGSGTRREPYPVAPPERVAAISTVPHEHPGASGR
jgi:hypothetical protein